MCVIGGFRHEVVENCILLGYYAASSRNFLPMFRNSLSVPYSGFMNPKGLGFLNPEDGTDGLSRNVGKKLPLPAA